MNKMIFMIAILLGIYPNSFSQIRKNGMPDMRYKVNKQSYSSPNVPYYYGYTNPNVRYQSGYLKSNGTYVEGHYKTNNNDTNWDNFSTDFNYNPYTGSTGTRAKDYSIESYNYGNGQTIYTGPKGGQYYINSNGNKVYVPKRPR